ncbi:N-6 DNA Methylase [Nonlabens sp. Hel1_33_55]|uniref:Eco57I restriction-modification methylase domain-containing protein n=1 Tax=Nonlabens sp. Hel1_33_55 TaxID=1336802 RepID=UPI000875DE70|nr:N-6 DNA methylase [Nonlabens sp. Hel1_33_55]SCY18997.1 N-6 DNA Methylase [Nonlabens sp. Hel1_33_55]
MALFQTSVLKKYLTQQDANILSKAYRKYAKYFLNPEIQENIRTSNEEQFQATFLTELFVNVLDYTINPSPKYNLTTEYKNEKNNRKADGAILNDGATVAVVELKGINTRDLESIRKQAFDYKVNHKGCRFVITSNFEKLRLYIDDATEQVAFDLFQLTEADFSLLYLCLHKDNLLKTIPLKIKQDSLIVEEQITKDFYKDYSLFKRELYRDLVKKNGKVLKVALQNDSSIPDDENHQNDLERLEKNVKLTLFKKSQKLIDRFLFIFFAEDRGLLQPNYTLKRLSEWDTIRKLDVDEPLYDRFKKHFNYLDKGRKGDAENKEIFAYNGGLFKPDSILDRVLIDDELLYKHTKKLATYDFESQVDVNILGHIFENSLNEIESINAEIEGGDFDKQKSKRKKDGVFYTPKYITKYIVENTVGKLCDEKKAALGFQEEEYFKGRGTGRNKRNDKTIQKLVTILDDYRDWLLQITICDPACGSGAFLNQALDFLIKEHQYIDELKTKILGGGLQFPDIENTILENNIYGVDLNEESVEIAKLSLWLRTAQPRRKLNDLSSNIKCGNSLIDSKSIAGDKAFHWETAFAKVFENGGFDVVIGNPPYVSHDRVDHPKYLKKHYSSYQSFADLFCYFYELGVEIIKENGKLSYITSNSFLKADYGNPLRKYLISNGNITQLINIEDAQIFSDAVVNSVILVFTKSSDKSQKAIIVNAKYDIKTDFLQFVSENQYDYNQEDLDSLSWTLIRPEYLKITQKLKGNHPTLEDLQTKIRLGIATGSNQAFLIDEDKKNELINKHYGSAELIQPILRGRDIHRYHYELPNQYILLSKNGIDIPKDYPAVYEHLESFGEKFKARGAKGQHWTNLRACSFFEDFKEEKIVWIELTDSGRFSLCSEEIYLLNSAYFLLPPDGILSGYLLAILNSKAMKFYLHQIANTSGVGTFRYFNIYVKEFPIPNTSQDNQKVFDIKSIDLKESILSFKKIKGTFKKYFESNYSLLKVSRKLENWQDLDFGDFIKELNKAIKATNKQRDKDGLPAIATLTKTDAFEWLDLFEQNKKKAQDLQLQINTIEQQIDAMVYELYGLSEDEIRIVEGS